MRISTMGIAAVLSAMIVSLASCGKRSRVIPRGDMARIYAEMFVIDQRIYFDREARGMADSLLVYEPIFEKYGYTSDDYRQSMAHYIKDPDRYARILRESTVILETRLRELRAEKEKLDLLSKGMAASAVFAPERIFFLSGMANKDLLTVDSLSFFIDSTGGAFDFDVQKGYDTVYSGPVFRVMSDTLTAGDSVRTVEDSIAVAVPENGRNASRMPVRKLKPTPVHLEKSRMK